MKITPGDPVKFKIQVQRKVVRESNLLRIVPGTLHVFNQLVNIYIAAV